MPLRGDEEISFFSSNVSPTSEFAIVIYVVRTARRGA